LNIGVLALQGDFSKHLKTIEKLGHNGLPVKDSDTLVNCDKLIIPGGESTTFLYLIDRLGLRDALIRFGETKAIMGTCAGLIVAANQVDDLSLEPLRMIDISVSRNAYGRQVDSFVAPISVPINGSKDAFEAVFIRAPRIISCGPSVKTLAAYQSDTVMARSENILVASFHPELTDDPRIHRYFIDAVG